MLIGNKSLSKTKEKFLLEQSNFFFFKLRKLFKLGFLPDTGEQHFCKYSTCSLTLSPQGKKTQTPPKNKPIQSHLLTKKPNQNNFPTA